MDLKMTRMGHWAADNIPDLTGKITNILFTYELQMRFETAGVDAIATAAHPG